MDDGELLPPFLRKRASDPDSPDAVSTLIDNEARLQREIDTMGIGFNLLAGAVAGLAAVVIMLMIRMRHRG